MTRPWAGAAGPCAPPAAYNGAMCGRYTLSAAPQRIAAHFGLDRPPRLEARYNIAPEQDVAVILQLPDGTRRLERMRWGLVPSWAQTPRIGSRLINARAETAARRPAFRSAFHQRRCLLPADGFYVWKAGPGGKQPHWVARPDREPLAFAGLWEHWENPRTGEVIRSCTLITRPAQGPLSALDNRMPAILAPRDYARWLDRRSSEAQLGEVLEADPGIVLEFRPVSREVNNPRNDYDALIAPLPGHGPG